MSERQSERVTGASASSGAEHEDRGIEIARTHEKVIRIVGDSAVHTFLDEDGNELHSIGFPRKPLFSEEEIAKSQELEEESQLI